MAPALAVAMAAMIAAYGCAHGEGGGLADTSIDTGIDTAHDTAGDTAMDTEGDEALDVPADSSADTAADLDADTAVDTTVDTAADTAIDTAVDTATDTTIDTAVDTITDTPADTITDPDAGDATGTIASWAFASCPDGWSARSLGHAELPALSWECGTPTTGPGSGHGGSGMLWATRLAANYRDFEWSALESPAVDLSAAAGAVTLHLWHWYEFEWCTSACGAYNPVPCALDGGNVEVWNGSAWVGVAPAGGYPGTLAFFDSYYTHPLEGAAGFNEQASGSSWQEETFDVSAYRGPGFRVRFVFGSDSGVSAAGWYVDDVSLTSP